MTNKITLEHVEDQIASTEYIRPQLSPELTICILRLANGFSVVGTSACADPKNYDEDLGKNIAYANAKQKIWELEGYVLRSKLAGSDVSDADANASKSAELAASLLPVAGSEDAPRRVTPGRIVMVHVDVDVRTDIGELAPMIVSSVRADGVISGHAFPKHSKSVLLKEVPYRRDGVSVGCPVAWCWPDEANL